MTDNVISFEDWNNRYGLVTDTPPARRSNVARTDGLYIEDWRRKAGLSQRAAADCLGLSAGTYSRIERGDARVTLDVVIRIAQLFGCRDMAELLEPPT